MIENPYYSPEMHGPYELFSLGDFVLEEGYTLSDCQLAAGHLGLFGLEPGYMEQIDRHLSELLDHPA